MAVTIEQIEKMERQLASVRQSGSCREVTSKPCHTEVPRIVLSEGINGHSATLTLTPTEALPPYNERVVLTKLWRVDFQKVNCNLQSRTWESEQPVLFQENGLFVRLPRGKGRQRFSSSEWMLVDPWMLVSGNKKDIKRLASLGIR